MSFLPKVGETGAGVGTPKCGARVAAKSGVGVVAEPTKVEGETHTRGAHQGSKGDNVVGPPRLGELRAFFQLRVA